MANLVITKSGNSIIVDYGVYGGTSSLLETKSSFSINDIVEIDFFSDHVLVMMRDAHGVNQWELTYNSSYSGGNFFIVDSVEGVIPSSESDLFDKLTALRG